MVKEKPIIVSALGAIPKDSGDIRLIHDCSRPQGQAVNDYAGELKVKYQTFQEALDLIKPGHFMAKVDLKSAYRSVSLHPSSLPATGLKWTFEGHTTPTYMVDTRLPFGSKVAPSIFHRLTQSVRRMLKKRGIHAVVVYLDDFLITAPTFAECLKAYNILISLLRTLGFQISWSKVVDPCQSLTFLGINIDTVSNMLTLPPSKLAELQQVIASFEHRTRATGKQLRSLSGKLNWACQAVTGGRTFLRRILNALPKLQRSRHKLRLNHQFHLDLQWWLKFLNTFNGKIAFQLPQPIVDVHLDACPVASGAYFRGDWVYTRFKKDHPAMAPLHINHKETASLLYAARRWAPFWTNSKVIVHSDNTTACSVLNRMTSRTPEVMDCLRELFWLAVQHNFTIQAKYVPGKLNVVADAISRLHETGHFAVLDSALGNCLNPHLLMNHMSQNSASVLSSQVRHWLRCKHSWTQKSQPTEVWPWQKLPRRPTDHIFEPTCSSASYLAAHPCLYPP